MNLGFWEKLNKPIFILAPMAGVTDTVFRQIVAKYGRPDVFYTEFVSCDGLCSPGRNALLDDLRFCNRERPILAQFFGSKPDNFYKSAALAAELQFDGIDINTGCPDKSVEKQGAGAALIRNPNLIKRIIKETLSGAGNLPVSVKTRLGYDRTDTDNWIKHLLESEPAAIIIHARTRNEMSRVPARWDQIAKAVEIRNNLGSQTLIIGNGDVNSLEQARKSANNFGADGIMIGRGIFGNPWLFNKTLHRSQISLEDRINVLLEHAALFEKTYGVNKHFAIMRKFFKSYVAGFPCAKSLRLNLMMTHNYGDVERVVAHYLASNSD